MICKAIEAKAKSVKFNPKEIEDSGSWLSTTLVESCVSVKLDDHHQEGQMADFLVVADHKSDLFAVAELKTGKLKISEIEAQFKAAVLLIGQWTQEIKGVKLRGMLVLAHDGMTGSERQLLNHRLERTLFLYGKPLPLLFRRRGAEMWPAV